MKGHRCRETALRLCAYLDGEEGRLCRETAGHLKGCSPCRAFLSTLRKTVRALKALRSAGPSGRQKAALRRYLLRAQRKPKATSS